MYAPMSHHTGALHANELMNVTKHRTSTQNMSASIPALAGLASHGRGSRARINPRTARVARRESSVSIILISGEIQVKRMRCQACLAYFIHEHSLEIMIQLLASRKSPVSLSFMSIHLLHQQILPLELDSTCWKAMAAKTSKLGRTYCIHPHSPLSPRKPASGVGGYGHRSLARPVHRAHDLFAGVQIMDHSQPLSSICNALTRFRT